MGKLPGTHPCIGTGHPRPETFLQSKTFPRTCCRTAGPSTALRSGRDDKGERGRFHGMFPTEWVAQVSILRPGYLRADLSYRNGRDDKGERGRLHGDVFNGVGAPGLDFETWVSAGRFVIPEHPGLKIETWATHSRPAKKQELGSLLCKETGAGNALTSSVSGPAAGYRASRRRPLDRDATTRRRNKLQSPRRWWEAHWPWLLRYPRVCRRRHIV